MFLQWFAGLCVIGAALAWDYTDEKDFDWEVQDLRVAGYSEDYFADKSSLLLKVSFGFDKDYKSFANAVNWWGGGLTVDDAITYTKNMITYGEDLITNMENDFNAAYAAQVASEKALQVIDSQLTEEEREAVQPKPEEEEEGIEKRSLKSRFEGALFKRDDFELDYDSSGSGDGEEEEPEDKRLWPYLYQMELPRNDFFKSEADSHRETLERLYALRPLLSAAYDEVTENQTATLLSQNFQTMMGEARYAVYHSLIRFAGMYHYARFDEAYNFYPEPRASLTELKNQLFGARGQLATLREGTFYPIPFTQKFYLRNKEGAQCENGTLSVVDCPISYFAKYGVTAFEIKKFKPWLEMFNRGKRVRLGKISAKLRGAYYEGTNDTEATIEVFNVGEMSDFFDQKEFRFIAAPLHLLYKYDQKKAADPHDNPTLIHQAEERYQAESTPFTGWMIRADEFENANLNIESVFGIDIVFHGEASFYPHP